MVLGVTVGSGLMVEALGAPRIRPWRPSAPLPAPASATIALRAAASHPPRSPPAGLLCCSRLLGRAPAAFLPQGASEPCCPAATLRATAASRPQTLSACSPRPEAGHAWAAPPDQVGTTPSGETPPPANYRGAKGQK